MKGSREVVGLMRPPDGRDRWETSRVGAMRTVVNGSVGEGSVTSIPESQENSLTRNQTLVL